jgi:hypothetical protein
MLHKNHKKATQGCEKNPSGTAGRPGTGIKKVALYLIPITNLRFFFLSKCNLTRTCLFANQGKFTVSSIFHRRIIGLIPNEMAQIHAQSGVVAFYKSLVTFLFFMY